MTNLKKYRLAAYALDPTSDLVMLSLERSGAIVEASVSIIELEHHNLDQLMEGSSVLAANIHEGRIMEFFIL